MKIPHRSDPGGNIEAALPRSHVLEVLVSHNISIIQDYKGSGVIGLVRDQQSVAQDLPKIVQGNVIRYLCREFGIPPTDFYNFKQTNFH